ncbi:hypothetical protein DK419_19720 [Methylobacterium terrae]|uniref:DUF4189 domain-containing protein n=1 Tax=Methylobacterium terrae TaxID=2202827 RepID=A0A2U8WS58_9HYPH|nr:DUF4189 domain-containing protein [Methylobacterium terrae]AWN48301.1 hypothetical protein DK419_19720 [Methylobacterium terrae]
MAAVVAVSVLGSGHSVMAQGAGWAALADNGHGNWGYAVGKASSAEASEVARRGCQAADCKVTAVKQASCIAYVVGNGGAKGYGMGASPDAAAANARSFCVLGAPADSCHVVKAACG